MEMKKLAKYDRAILEQGSKSFMSFLKAYKEHMLTFIFRFDSLDIGAVARAYALLRCVSFLKYSHVYMNVYMCYACWCICMWKCVCMYLCIYTTVIW